jgi:5-methyltetrahydropteroyltriglutamate--homocysteine methyltransferase
MRRSADAILTTHVGSLPGRGEAANAQDIAGSVTKIVAAQKDIGLDIVNEGELTKGGDWLSYIDGRLGGFERREGAGTPIIAQGRDRQEFADFYSYAAERGTLFYVAKDKPLVKRNSWVCTGPIHYVGQAAMRSEIETFKAPCPTMSPIAFLLRPHQRAWSHTTPTSTTPRPRSSSSRWRRPCAPSTR